MNNRRQFEAPALDDPEGRYQILVYSQTVGTTDEHEPDTCRVKSWVRSELVLRQDLPSRWRRSVQQVEKMMILSVVLSLYRFTVNRR